MALISAVLCVVLMFLMDWRYAAGTIGCQLLLGAYIFYRCEHKSHHHHHHP